MAPVPTEQADSIILPDIPPPPFEPYNADFFETDDGDIVSHDPHLNTDGEALYRFLLEQSALPPCYILRCNGTHQETRTRRVIRTTNGRTETHTERYTVTITDFDFCIDLSNQIVVGPVHWSLADCEPSYRGCMVRQVQEPQGRRKATLEEIDQFKTRERVRADEGLPPWVDPDGTDHLNVLQSSITLRQWADEYCTSPKVLKEFVYEKFVHGWDMGSLEIAASAAIREAGYQGVIKVDFDISATKIYVRADNKLSRTLSKTFVKFLLIVTLIYPFIWLFKRYGSKGGGRWEVCGGAYALKHVEPLPLREGDPLPLPELRSGVEPRIIDTPNGVVMIYGLREGEWFRQWETVIKQSAISRLQRLEPMTTVADGSSVAACGLDGYHA